MNILATMVDHDQDGLMPAVLLDAIGQSDVAVLINHPLFALSASLCVQWTLERHEHVYLHVEVNAYTSLSLDTSFAWKDYSGWLSDVAKADRLRLIPVVDAAHLEQSLIEPDAPGLTIRNFAGDLQAIVAHLKAKNGIF